jgi:acyl-coenzyme A synthetase/AMP-(fatty) acid ligase
MKRALGKMVVGNILTTAAIRYRHETAIYCSSTERRFSFHDVDERVNRLAHVLLGLGFCKGDVVAFLPIAPKLLKSTSHWRALASSACR